MSKPFPQEFGDDVVRVAEKREPNVILAQIAKDFGVHIGTLAKWMRQARIEASEQPGATQVETAELRELRKRNRLLEDDPDFGYRLLADEARAEYGEAMSGRAAWRIASANGWSSACGNLYAGFRRRLELRGG